MTRPGIDGNYIIQRAVMLRSRNVHRLVDLIKKHGADMFVGGRHGVSALHIAVLGNNLEGSKALKKIGHFEFDDGWKRTMHWAIDYGMMNIFKYLLEKGYDVREASLDGVTIGEKAYNCKNGEILIYCLGKRASPYHESDSRIANLDPTNSWTLTVMRYLLASQESTRVYRDLLEGASAQLMRCYRHVENNRLDIELIQGVVDLEYLFCDLRKNWEHEPNRRRWEEIQNTFGRWGRLFTYEIDGEKRLRRAEREIMDVGRWLPYHIEELVIKYRSKTVTENEANTEWEPHGGGQRDEVMEADWGEFAIVLQVSL